MSSRKLYGRVTNFEDLEPLTSVQDEDDDEPFSRGTTAISFTRRSKRLKKWVLCSLLVVLVVLVVAVALSIAVSLAIGETQGSSGRGECSLDPYERFDCLPGLDATNKSLCTSFGCCWEVKRGSPSCFYSELSGYSVLSVQPSPLGQQVALEGGVASPYGPSIPKLSVEFRHETNTRLRIRVTDAGRSRYEVPLPTPPVTSQAPSPLYNVTVEDYHSFSFSVARKDTGVEIFKLAPGLVFSDQFLQMSSYLPSSNVYGLGEHADRLRLNTNHSTYTLFASDIGTNPDDPSRNLYGVHPFYLCLEASGQAHGVFLLNSNAMEVYLTPKPSLTWRSLGGILDLYLFIGPSPAAVVSQLTEVIGRPHLPPYWALGFHLCRWGYGSANNTQTVVEEMRRLEIPQDVQWSDIDYMDRKLVFTYDKEKFRELPQLVDNLHHHDQRYIIIVDPGINNKQRGYAAYDSGLTMDVFIKNSSGQPIVGKVWPNETVYPDFTHPNATSYWSNLIQDFHKVIAFDGLWIDMNEPSNFVHGSITGCHGNEYLDHPPFVPKVIRSQDNGILTKTLCMSASQNSSSHYNLHSLYGHTEAVVTRRSLDRVLGVRSLLISRSTYTGGGHHTGHWLGDNTSQWKHLKASIPGILDFSLFAIPMVGADICGFFGDTTEELCTRWHQLGAFYPFSRNHNTFNARAQDPTVWSNETIDAIREVLTLRYRLLPYLYTLFYWAHVSGSTVARPLFFEYPLDNVTWSLDTQFLWGRSLLVSPVLDQGLVSVDAYFPQGRWFDLRNGSEVRGTGHMTLDAPLSYIPLHVRGGSILPTQAPGLTTAQSRKNPYSLVVAMDTDLQAEGTLYLDDGDSLNSVATGNYSLYNLTASRDGLVGHVTGSHVTDVRLDEVVVYGLDHAPTDVRVNNVTATFTWASDRQVLFIGANCTSISSALNVQWTL